MYTDMEYVEIADKLMHSLHTYVVIFEKCFLKIFLLIESI